MVGLKMINRLITHKGRKQWPIYKERYPDDTDPIRYNQEIDDCPINWLTSLWDGTTIIDAMQITKDFEMAERKNYFSDATRSRYSYFCKINVDYNLFCSSNFPNRTEKPKWNNEGGRSV